MSLALALLFFLQPTDRGSIFSLAQFERGVETHLTFSHLTIKCSRPWRETGEMQWATFYQDDKPVRLPVPVLEITGRWFCRPWIYFLTADITRMVNGGRDADLFAPFVLSWANGWTCRYDISRWLTWKPEDVLDHMELIDCTKSSARR